MATEYVSDLLEYFRDIRVKKHRADSKQNHHKWTFTGI